MSLNEADTCRVFVTPRLRSAGWEEPPHLIAEQQTFTDGRVRIVAVNRTLQAILLGQLRILLCMATGTGKTVVAFQICWKLWTARWTRDGAARKTRILFLADRNILVDDPKDKDFAPFGNARWKIEGGIAEQSRQMYFAIVFCVDQEHAAAMRQALTNLNQDLVAKHPHYVERVTAEEGETGRGFLSNFQDPEQSTPVILTTSQMLTTGVDVPTCRNLVLVRVINRVTEFKQIIGHLVYEQDDDGRQLRVIQYTDYSAAQIRTLFRSADALSADWADPVTREQLLARLERVGIHFADLAEATGNPDADPLDLLCHLTFQRPLRTRRERAEHLRRNRPDFFDQYSAAARGILDTLLDQYTEHGPEEFQITHALKHPTIAARGNVMEIADLFGGPLAMRQSVNQLQALLYTDTGAS